MTTTIPSPTIHIVPDKAGSSSESSFSAHISRSLIKVSRHSEDKLNYAELREYQFPVCIDNELWLESIQPILESSENPLSLVVIEPDSFQLVPKALYREEDASKILELAGNESSDQLILVEEVGPLEAVLLWSIPKNVYNLINWQNRKLIPDILPTIMLNSGEKEDAVYVMARPEKTDVAVFKNGLQLLNSYRTPTDNDSLYFLIAACESCGLEAGKTSIELSGEASPEFKKLLSNYFKKVVSRSVPEKVNVPYAFKEQDPANWSALLNLHLCV